MLDKNCIAYSLTTILYLTKILANLLIQPYLKYLIASLGLDAKFKSIRNEFCLILLFLLYNLKSIKLIFSISLIVTIYQLVISPNKINRLSISLSSFLFNII